MFVPFAVNVTPVADASDALEDDEDYWKDPGTNKTHVAVLTEIWNYYDRTTDILLGLRDAEYAYSYVTPIFNILELSKKVMERTCPPWYLKPGFLDLSVNSFIQMLRKRRYFSEFGNDFDGLERVTDALLNCSAHVTPFPFKEFEKDRCNETVSESWQVQGVPE
jgi:hypothetical protein